MDEDIATTILEQAAVEITQIETQTGKFYGINQRYCNIVGYIKQDMTETTFMEITHPVDIQEDREK